MAATGAERQRAYVARQRDTVARQAGLIEALRTELKAVRAENAVLKAALSRARQTAPKPPRRPRDLAQYLYPSTRRQERP